METDLFYVLVQISLFIALYRACVVAGGSRIIGFSPVIALLVGVLGAGALVVASAAFLAIGSSFRIQPEPRPGASLVDRGIYRYLRHPMYTAVVLFAATLFLLKGTLLAGATAAAVIVFHFIKAQREEILLLGRYGGYAEYMARTWGIIPGIPWRRGTTPSDQHPE
jgi:protein-S-isoprenylcysteine O-methyltransferase Ste14